MTLSGSATDSDGSVTRYEWTQTSGPSVALYGTNTLSPYFTAPNITTDTTLEFTLTVFDDRGASASDVVGIQVSPAAWEDGTALTSARWGHTACSVNGKIYVFGGADHETLVQEFDIAARTWSTKASIPQERRYGAACAVADGKIYLIGGFNNTNATSAVGNVEAYDPVTNTWIARAPLPTPRYNLTASVVNGRIYAIAGRSFSLNAMGVVEEYDPAANAWIARASLPIGRHSPASATVGGKVYVFGGFNDGLLGPTSDAAYEYNPVADSWRAVASMPTARWFMSAASVGGKIYVLGGVAPVDGLAIVEAYDPMMDQWTTKANMPTARGLHASTVAANAIYILGGQSSVFAPPLASVEIYNPAQDP